MGDVKGAEYMQRLPVLADSKDNVHERLIKLPGFKEWRVRSCCCGSC